MTAPQSLRPIRDGAVRLLVGTIRVYRLVLSPWLGNACRFEPTCSAYAIVAIERHGPLAGTVLGTGRILRCHPWCAGGHDPVPAVLPRPFGRARPSDPVGAPAGHDASLSRSRLRRPTRLEP
jgi:hypothetical protein